MEYKHWFYWQRYFGKQQEWFVCIQVGPWWTLELSLWLAGPILEIGLLFVSLRLGRWRIDPTPLDVDLSRAQVYTWDWGQMDPATGTDAVTLMARQSDDKEAEE